MTQEQEELLLKDLCARLPYRVILNCCEIVNEPLTLISYKGLVNNDYDIDEVKPYLFPLSSMTEEQKKEYDSIIYHNVELHWERYYDVIDIDWYEVLHDFYNKNHFDYRSLIPMGLANDTTNKNIY